MSHGHPSEVLHSNYNGEIGQKFDLAKYACLGLYLGAPNMVKWGVPEKILQNAVQTRWSQVNRTLQSKVMAKSNFWPISPLQLQCKTKNCLHNCVYGSIMLKFFLVAHLTYENQWVSLRNKIRTFVFLGHPTGQLKIQASTIQFSHILISMVIEYFKRDQAGQDLQSDVIKCSQSKRNITS